MTTSPDPPSSLVGVVSGTKTDGPRPRPAILAASLFLLALLGVQAAWLLSVPPSYGIDEFDHLHRASSVASGHWRAGSEVAEQGRGVLIPADEAIVRASFGSCDALDYMGPDNCRPLTQPNADGEVLIASAAGNYNPAWYLVVGTAGQPFEGINAINAMRFASMLLCDALLFLAAMVSVRHSRSWWPLVGISAVSTPVVLYATTVVAPNGVQYAAGILMWSVLVAMWRCDTHRHIVPRHLWLLFAGSAALVATVHTTGPLWVVLILTLTLPLTGRLLIASWVRQRVLLLTTGAAVLASVIASVVWIATAGTNSPGTPGGGGGGGFPPRQIVQGPFLWFFQSLATLRFRDDPAPMTTYAALALLILAIVAVGMWKANKIIRVVVGLIAVSAAVVPLLLTWLTYEQLGSAWQGRYALPLTVGIVIIASSQLDQKVSDYSWVPWAAAGLVGVGHVTAVGGMFAERLPGAPHAPWWALVLLGGAYVALMGSSFAAARDRMPVAVLGPELIAKHPSRP